jgi:hypothetical protein
MSHIKVSKSTVFAAHETHGRALRPGNRLISHSQDAGWRSLLAARASAGGLRCDQARDVDRERRVRGDGRDRAAAVRNRRSTHRRLRRSANAAEESRVICAELIEGLRAMPGVAGAHIMAPGGGSRAIAEVLELVLA